MCLAPEVDLVAGVVIGVVALDAARHVRRPAEWPLAAIPLVLAGHQLVEVLVWRGLREQLPASTWRPAMYAYLAVSFVVLPVLVPAAVRALEPPGRRQAMGALTSLGVAVATVLGTAMVAGPVEAAVEGRRISYEVPLWHGGTIVAFYVLATCGAMLVSSFPRLRWFGAANLVAAGGLAWVDKVGFISLWCLWAAVSSVAVAAHLRFGDQPRERMAERPSPVT